MIADHERFALWDAAYAVGALSAQERREYEDHLATCEECRGMIAEIMPTVALLSRVAPHTGTVTDVDGPDASNRQAIVRLADRRRRRHRARIWYSGAAAGLLLVAGIGIASALSPGTEAPTPMANVAQVPLEASVVTDQVAWGTRIDLTCSYPDGTDGSAPAETWTYVLAVVDKKGEATTVSSWKAKPGSTARLTAGTALDESEIRAIEIRSADGTVLMSAAIADGEGPST
ncbi:anti-sigma factor [Microbacterium tumbae]